MRGSLFYLRFLPTPTRYSREEGGWNYYDEAAPSGGPNERAPSHVCWRDPQPRSRCGAPGDHPDRARSRGLCGSDVRGNLWGGDSIARAGTGSAGGGGGGRG